MLEKRDCSHGSPDKPAMDALPQLFGRQNWVPSCFAEVDTMPLPGDELSFALGKDSSWHLKQVKH